MTAEGGQKPNLIELYDKYDREGVLQAWGVLGATVIGVGVTGLMVVTTPSSVFYEVNEGVVRPNAEVFQKWAINVITGGYTLLLEGGVGFIGWERSEARSKKTALEIAEVEGRVPDQSNDKRVLYTSALASTLVYGIEFNYSRWSKFVNAFARPMWEMSIPYATPGERRAETFESFDDGVNSLPFDDWIKDEVGLAALNLGKKRWERIAEGKGSNRLRSYSYVMLSEINERLGDAPLR